MKREYRPTVSTVSPQTGRCQNIDESFFCVTDDFRSAFHFLSLLAIIQIGVVAKPACSHGFRRGHTTRGRFFLSVVCPRRKPWEALATILGRFCNSPHTTKRRFSLHKAGNVCYVKRVGIDSNWDYAPYRLAHVLRRRTSRRALLLRARRFLS